MDSETSSTSEDGEQELDKIDGNDLKTDVLTESDDMTDEHLPDISVHCPECNDPIAIQFLSAHQSYHHALNTLGYGCHKIPDNLTALLKRRNSLAKKWKDQVIEDASASGELQKIDNAYGLLRSYLDGTHNERFVGRNQFDLECRPVGLSCSTGCILATGLCWSQNSRWKNAMEDTRVFQDYYGNDAAKCFFAVFDGHNGRFAADVAANDLHHYLLEEMIQFDPRTSCMCAVNHADKNDLSDYPIDRPKPIVRKGSINHILHRDSVNVPQQIMHTCPDGVEVQDSDANLENHQSSPGYMGQKVEASEARNHTSQDHPYSTKMKQALKRAFMQTDHTLSFGVHEESRVRWSGCSALVCMVQDGDGGNHFRGGHDSASQEGSPTHLGNVFIANAGNVHAVLSRGGQVHQLTGDHSPANPAEKERLLKAGVSIHAGRHHGKANGILEATRGLGNHGDPLLKSAILWEPHIVSAKIDQYAEFLILASNGLWEVLTNEEAVEVVQTGIKLENHEKPIDDAIGMNQSTSSTEEPTAENTVGSAVPEQQVSCEVPEEEVSSPEYVAGHEIDNDFERMVSSLVKTGDGSETDIDTLTKAHSDYAKAHPFARHSAETRVRSIAERVSERLVQAAILAGARDNITVMVILLPGCDVNGENH